MRINNTNESNTNEKLRSTEGARGQNNTKLSREIIHRYVAHLYLGDVIPCVVPIIVCTDHPACTSPSADNPSRCSNRFVAWEGRREDGWHAIQARLKHAEREGAERSQAMQNKDRLHQHEWTKKRSTLARAVMAGCNLPGFTPANSQQSETSSHRPPQQLALPRDCISWSS